ncbi:endonuclease/exonuclease/phosphatase family protein [Streptomyces albipurpureus]|uniref:Endonuclease/exonuclease/phosphatase family protein n=1 Tax=Streptomyces albipurpureus TaxID=2897419 RepID=A0ABT0UKJ3_9ACTN|nr:endonuclease/exonuclease/phosphatase family protein [Streptomyces sp. CWNU-1]
MSRGRSALVASSLLVAGLLTFPGAVPNGGVRLGSLLETFLPWLGLAIPVLIVLACLRRSVIVWSAFLVPVVAWLAQFGGLLPLQPGAGYDLTVVQHNVSDENADPSGTARKLLKANADLIALEELTSSSRPTIGAVLAPDYPHHVVVGTVGLWSKLPLTDARRVDIKPKAVGEGWDRGMRVTAKTEHGDIAVYVAHLPSVRLSPSAGFRSAWRDESAALLGMAIVAERLEKVILLGDLNSTVDDRGLSPLTSQLDPPRTGLAFSWPARFPLARIDQIMTRTATATHIWSLPPTTSDHLPIAAHIRL